MKADSPRLLVYSSLFPSGAQPGAGLFIRERLFRVGRQLPIVVVSPKPWFPGQSLIRRFRPGYRPMPARREIQEGVEVHYPRFFALPGMLRQWDGFFMALGSWRAVWRLKREFGVNLIDAHFAYPDGYAAGLLGRWLDLPVTLTLRGTELPHSRNPRLRPLLVKALRGTRRVFAVSDSLRQLALRLGAAPGDSRVVGNGVDAEKFQPRARGAARRRLGLPEHAQVLISVGALVERKGFHRVLEILPRLARRYPDLHYLIVGGASPEGDREAELRAQAAALGVAERVHFLGVLPPEELAWPLSAADVFVLATGNEGWANVFLEAMACGLPVVTTDVGGNREVVNRDELGMVVPFGDAGALAHALERALAKTWDKTAIRAHAQANSWDRRVEYLVNEFQAVHREAAASEVPTGRRRTAP